jgi:hypothetical protein
MVALAKKLRRYRVNGRKRYAATAVAKMIRSKMKEGPP